MEFVKEFLKEVFLLLVSYSIAGTLVVGLFVYELINAGRLEPDYTHHLKHLVLPVGGIIGGIPVLAFCVKAFILQMVAYFVKGRKNNSTVEAVSEK